MFDFDGKGLPRTALMSKAFIQCPKDPKMEYYREVCTEIFRKKNLRSWCKSCEMFQDQNPSTRGVS